MGFLGPYAREVVLKNLPPGELKKASQLTQRFIYLERILKEQRVGIDSDLDIESLNLERKALEPVASAYLALSRELQSHEELNLHARFFNPATFEAQQSDFESGKRRTKPDLVLDREMQTSKILLGDLDYSVRQVKIALTEQPSRLAKLEREARGDVAEREKIKPPDNGSGSYKDGFMRISGEKNKRKVVEILAGAIANPQVGVTKKSFQTKYRFLEFTANSTHYRVMYEILNDGTVYFHALGPHENFYDSIKRFR